MEEKIKIAVLCLDVIWWSILSQWTNRLLTKTLVGTLKRSSLSIANMTLIMFNGCLARILM